MKFTRTLIVFILCTLYFVLPAQDSWQWTKKLGCNHAYDFELPQVLKTLMDSKGNQYIVYYITGDTFYYGSNYKRYIAGGDGYALCKVKCDGSLAWCKIITHGRKSKADLTASNFNTLFFGKDENNILISAGISIYSSNYIDTDTTLGTNINGYTIIYDSTGIAKKKIVNKSNQLGLSFASGYFPRTNQYFNGAYIDSTATNRVFFNGNYLTTGDYFALLDSNFNYVKLTPIVQYTGRSFAQWDSTQPVILQQYYLGSPHVIGTKVVFESGANFDPAAYTNPLYTPKYLVIGRDTIRAKDMPVYDQFVAYVCYNDTGGQEWTRFFYPNVAGASNFPDNPILDKLKKEFFIKRDYNGTWKYQNQLISSNAANSTKQINVFKIDSNGNFLWHNPIVTGRSASTENRFPACNSKGELILNLHIGTINGNHYGVTINNQLINSYANPPMNVWNGKHILLSVNRTTLKLLDTTSDETRFTSIDRISIDPSDNIYVHGVKKINGCILNNDSSAIEYAVGQDNFIAKFGKANCTCDPIKSAYKALDSTTDGRITLQYTGLPSDSVRYLWDDGTWSVAKPSITATTKIYNQNRTVTIRCVSYNSCGQTDTFKKTYIIKCTALTSRFILTDSNGKTITAQYTGTATDSVRFLWGDGNNAWATSPSTKLMNYTYTTSVDSVKISAIVKNKCGQADTFSRWYKFCSKPSLSITIDSSQKAQRKITVTYTGADSFILYWGDGTSTMQKSSNKTYTNSGTYTLKWVIKNKCGLKDSFSKSITVGTSSIQSINPQSIKIYPNPAKERLTIEFAENFRFVGEIQFYDLLGRQIDLPPHKREKSVLVIDVSNIPQGSYFLKLENFSFKVQIER